MKTHTFQVHVPAGTCNTQADVDRLAKEIKRAVTTALHRSVEVTSPKIHDPSPPLAYQRRSEVFFTPPVPPEYVNGADAVEIIPEEDFDD
jgi:hypothetical protein